MSRLRGCKPGSHPHLQFPEVGFQSNRVYSQSLSNLWVKNKTNPRDSREGTGQRLELCACQSQRRISLGSFHLEGPCVIQCPTTASADSIWTRLQGEESSVGFRYPKLILEAICTFPTISSPQRAWHSRSVQIISSTYYIILFLRVGKVQLNVGDHWPRS